jgi:acyl-ACP thioesterase
VEIDADAEVDDGSLKEHFVVRSFDLDPFGRASLRALSAFCQDAAGLHAVALGVGLDALLEKNLAWAMVRFRMEIDQEPALHEQVTVETWPSQLERLYAHRDFLITGAGGRVLARATSAWVIFDVGTRRAGRVKDELGHIPVVLRPRLIALSKKKPPELERPDLSRPFRVRLGDLDVNGHTNNVRYFEWTQESVPRDVLTSHRLAMIEIAFRAESIYDDELLASSQRIDDGGAGLGFVHQILRTRDQIELARAETRWVSAPAGRPSPFAPAAPP